MKQFLFLLMAAVSGGCLSAQNTVVHDDNAQVRKVGSFHAIKVSSGIHLYLKQGDETAVAVSASSADITDRIKTEVVNGRLEIYVDNRGMSWWNNKSKNLKAYVTCADIDGLESNSGAFAEIDGSITAAALNLDVSSGAGLSGEITAGKLMVDESSGAHAEIKGKAKDVSVKTSSGASFEGFDMVSENCKADASSGGNIEITVNKQLDATASSGGDIHYKGDAAISSIDNSSGGRVKKVS